VELGILRFMVVILKGRVPGVGRREVGPEDVSRQEWAEKEKGQEVLDALLPRNRVKNAGNTCRHFPHLL
jgi:hypothetical protein